MDYAVVYLLSKESLLT